MTYEHSSLSLTSLISQPRSVAHKVMRQRQRKSDKSEAEKNVPPPPAPQPPSPTLPPAPSPEAGQGHLDEWAQVLARQRGCRQVKRADREELLLLLLRPPLRSTLVTSTGYLQGMPGVVRQGAERQEGQT